MTAVAIGQELGAARAGGGNVPYRNIPDYLAQHVPFRGSSMSAHYETDGTYNVFSYATCIATWRSGDGAEVIAKNRWGNTTGRHINLCRKYL